MKRTNHTLLPSMLAVLIFAAPALADDAYASAQAAYSQGKYMEAKTEFLGSIKAKPTWQAYYQLANCYVQLKDTANATKAYQSCESLKPPAETKKLCDQAIQYLSKNSLVTKAPPDPVVPSPKTDAPTLADTTSADPHQQALQAQREKIMQEANKQAEAVRAQAKAELDELKASSNVRYVSQDGAVVTDVDHDTTSRISSEAETKVQRILDEARRRVENLK